MMKIKKTITIQLEKKGKNFIAYDNASLGLLMGGSSVSQNPHMWAINKPKGTNQWVVPVSSVRKRLAKLRRDIDSINQKIEIIEQILGDNNAE